MAWVDVPGSNNIWQYENSASGFQIHIQIQAQVQTQLISGGIRTYTKPGTSDTVKVYIRTRKKGETTERGELSKTYYDNQ